MLTDKERGENRTPQYVITNAKTRAAILRMVAIASVKNGVPQRRAELIAREVYEKLKEVSKAQRLAARRGSKKAIKNYEDTITNYIGEVTDYE